MIKSARELYEENNVLNKSGKIPFHEYFKTVYSQWGEDGILEEIFERIKCENKYFVEFGAGDGKYISNTAFLRLEKNWNGLLLEGDKNLVEKGGGDSIKLYHEMIYSNNINELFEKYKVPKNFGLLSIDIDGDDAYVFDALNFNKFCPDVIICEFNPGLPNHRGIKIIEQKGNLSNGDLHMRGYIGANICEIYNVAQKKGYEFVTSISVNLIFVKKELFDLLKIPKLNKEEIMSIHSYLNGHEEWKKDIYNFNDNWEVSEN
jgi:hypothetical protein